MSFEQHPPHMSASERAEELSASCFLNAYLREKTNHRARTLPDEIAKLSDCREGLRICGVLNERAADLWIPMRKVSLIGRHVYAWPFYFAEEKGLTRASFAACVAFISRDMALEMNPPAGAEETFLARVQESCDTIREVLDRRADAIWAIPEALDEFSQAEQGLIVGHSFHPTPRSRGGWQAGERELYCPRDGR